MSSPTFSPHPHPVPHARTLGRNDWLARRVRHELRRGASIEALLEDPAVGRALEARELLSPLAPDAVIAAALQRSEQRAVA